MLDLSWNIIGEKGAISFAAALLHNTSLSELNIASNSIGDNGGQRVIKSLKVHKRMAKFNVSQNDIADGSCFVAAQVRTTFYYDNYIVLLDSPPADELAALFPLLSAAQIIFLIM